MSKPKYIVMGDPPSGLSHSVVDDINSFICIAKNFKKAYEMAMFLGSIKNPDLSYRQALSRYKDDEHVFLNEQGDDTYAEDSGRVLITRVNEY